MTKNLEKEENTVQEWIDEFGGVTSYSFMIYGPMTIKDNAILNRGLTMTMISSGLGELRFIQDTEEVDAEAAEMYNLNRGWNIQWIFPGELDKQTGSIIIKTIEEGLDFLRLVNAFLGTIGGSNV